MRLSVSHKVFFAFCTLFLLTATFSVTIYLGVDRIARDQKRTKVLVAFRTTLTELGHFHEDGRFHLNFHENNEGFRSTVGRALESAGQINLWTDVANFPARHGFDLVEQVGFYRSAAEELLHAEQLEGQLRSERRALLLELYPALSSEAGEGDAAVRALRDETSLLGLKSSEAVSLPVLSRIRSLRARAGRLSGRSVTLIEALNLSLERSYLNELTIENRTEFLSDTMHHFQDDISAILESIQRSIGQEERSIRTLILIVLILSALATIALWLLASRKISAYVRHFKFSLDSIRRGNYGYEIGQVSKDEFGDSLRFVKSLAESLEEQIREAEAARAEGEALQQQLVQAQKMESIGRLAGGVAHDFNNLLMGIIGYAELGLLRLPEGQPERDFFQSIIDNAEKAARLTSQLLAFSRRQVLQRRSVDPNTIVSECAKMLGRIIGDDIVLELQLQEGVRAIFADPDQVDQVLLNLAVNARDSMPKGGRLTISTGDIFLDEAYAAHHEGVAPGRYVKIEVTDTGAGIAPEIQSKVFEPFFTTKEAGRGTGLGLATVFGIVKQHEGQVWLYSEVGRGTSFKVYFPASESAAEVREPVRISDTGLRGSETVLVVDDNADVRTFLQTALSLHDYTVLSASGREEGLAHLALPGQAVDVLLTDLIMPGTNGRELADEICAMHPDIRVIFMSGYADRVFVNGELREDPAMHFLQKPVTPTVLLRKIREICAVPGDPNRSTAVHG